MPRGPLHDCWIRSAGFLLVLLFGLSWSLNRPGPCQDAQDGFHSQGKVAPAPALFLTESKHVARKSLTAIVKATSVAPYQFRPSVELSAKRSFSLPPDELAPKVPDCTPRHGRGPPSGSALA